MVDSSPSEKLSAAFAKAAELGIGPRFIPSRRRRVGEDSRRKGTKTLLGKALPTNFRKQHGS